MAPRSGYGATVSDGDVLSWNSTTDSDWYSANTVWYDQDSATRTGVSGPVNNISVQNYPSNTFGFSFGGTTANSTVAPSAMTISAATLGVGSINFYDGFAANNTMTVGGGRTNLYTQLNFASNAGLNNYASGGTITFNPDSGSNNAALFFNLAGPLGVNVNNANASVVLNVGVVGNSGSITKSGAGSLTLAGGLNNYGGTTTVNGGTLVVLSYTGGGAVTVSGTGTLLTGTGSLFGGTTVNSGAIISPGTGANTVGTLTLRGGTATPGLTLNGTYQVDIANVSGAATADLLNVASGALTLNTSSILTLGTVDRSALQVGGSFTIANDTATGGLVLGTFSNAGLNGTVTDSYGDVFAVGYSTSSITLTLESFGAIPEPSSWIGGVLASLLVAGAWVRRQRVAGPQGAAGGTESVRA